VSDPARDHPDPIRATPQGVSLDVIAQEPAAAPPADPDAGRPFIGVYFACAHQYVRVLRDVRRTEYLARCPSCGKTKRFQVGPGGSSRRLFQLTCR